MVFEIAARTRRMIFPDRVLGMSGTMRTSFGRAIFPIVVSMAWTILSLTSLVGATPGLSDTYTSGTRPFTSSATGTTAASATSGTVRQADSSSLVPSRWPATLMTSSTRPRILKYPSAACRAPSPAKYGQSRQSLLLGFLLYFA